MTNIEEARTNSANLALEGVDHIESFGIVNDGARDTTLIGTNSREGKQHW